MARTTQETSKTTATKRKSSTTVSPRKSTAKSVNQHQTDKTATKPATSKRTPTLRPKPAQLVRLTSQQRHALIAEAAYLRAEKQGFQGDPIEHWLVAEQEVDEKLSEHAIAS